MTTMTKPVTRRCAAKLPHGFRDQLIITLYPGSIVEVREPRKPPVAFDLAKLYAKAIIQKAWEDGAKKRKRRAK